MKTAFLLLLALALPAPAHMVSISTGDLRVEGTRAHYRISMPAYEVTNLPDPGKALLGAVQFSSAGAPAALRSSDCRRDAAEAAEICEADYDFPAPVVSVDVRSSLPAITVPNHVHLLRATLDGKSDQAVLDYSFPAVTLRFQPPSFWQTAAHQTVAGAWRATAGPVQLLFLAALVIASRTRRELALLGAMFLLGEVAACLAIPALHWQPPPRFVEAAAALTVAYLAVESLFLAQAGQRWVVVFVLGVIHGLYFATFVQESGYHAGWILAGMSAAEAGLLAVLGIILARLARLLAAFQPARIANAALLVAGLGWFLLRLKA